MKRRKLNTLSALLLLIGFSSAVAIYLLAAPEPPDDPLLKDPRAERRYHRELAMYGGKANVLSAEFLDWFNGLWHGRSLAGTVVVLTFGGTLAFRFMASLPGPVSGPAGPDSGTKES